MGGDVLVFVSLHDGSGRFTPWALRHEGRIGETSRGCALSGPSSVGHECRIRVILLSRHAEFWEWKNIFWTYRALRKLSEVCESSFGTHVEVGLRKSASIVLQLFDSEAGGKQGRRAADDSETIENPASNFRRLDGRDDFHRAATARALQHEKWAK